LSRTCRNRIFLTPLLLPNDLISLKMKCICRRETHQRGHVLNSLRKYFKVIVLSLNHGRSSSFKKMIVRLAPSQTVIAYLPVWSLALITREWGQFQWLIVCLCGRVQDSSHMNAHDRNANLSGFQCIFGHIPFRPSPELCSVCSSNIESISLRSWFLINWSHFYSISFSGVAICDLADRTRFHRIGNPWLFSKEKLMLGRFNCGPEIAISDIWERTLSFVAFPGLEHHNSFFTQAWRGFSFSRSLKHRPARFQRFARVLQLSLFTNITIRDNFAIGRGRSRQFMDFFRWTFDVTILVQ
jgi:hypothetical protein